VRAIRKGREPAALTQYRATNPADYENYPGKAKLRDALVSEQCGLCAYCMGRIRNEHNQMKIEHWRSHARYPAQRLQYRNLLGVCRGGEGQPPTQQHCDTRKGDRDLQWNPADGAHNIESHIWYDTDGTIRSYDETFDQELCEVLNLNLKVLMNSRKEALEGIREWWMMERRRLQGRVPPDRLERKLAGLTAGDGMLRPFSRVAAWWVEKKLQAMRP